jgi:hypothetical protein
MKRLLNDVFGFTYLAFLFALAIATVALPVLVLTN